MHAHTTEPRRVIVNDTKAPLRSAYYWTFGAAADGVTMTLHLTLLMAELLIARLRTQPPRTAPGLPAFIYPEDALSCGWGFGPVMDSIPSPHVDWVAFTLTLPRSKEWDELNAVAGTIAAVSKVMHWNCIEAWSEADVHHPVQLMFIQGMHPADGGAAPLEVRILGQFQRWLEAEGDNAEIILVEAMRAARAWIRSEPCDPTDILRCRLTEGGVIDLIQVPGKAASLVLGDSNDNSAAGEGYNLEPCNVDGPLQQLTLLSGLFALWGRAHNELYGH